MYEFLLEILCEEIPASIQKPAAKQIADLMKQALIDSRLNAGDIAAYWTPRRLIVYVAKLEKYSESYSIERKGPKLTSEQKIKDAFIARAVAEGFTQQSSLQKQEKGEIVEYICAKKIVNSRDAAEIFRAIMPEVLANVKWPKSMRWGASDNIIRWIRPIKNIMAILSEEGKKEPQIIDFCFGKYVANGQSWGHRSLGEDSKIFPKNFADYQKKLHQNHVIIDAEERCSVISQKADKLASEHDCSLVSDDALLYEVANLVEFPVMLLGNFDEAFLELPSRVIQTTIKENQKCFVVKTKHNSDDELQLKNYFILCSNMPSAQGGCSTSAEVIRKGNEKVIHARLSDAKFFWDQDRKLLEDIKESFNDGDIELDASKPLDQRMIKMIKNNALYYSGLGTQYERIKRIVAIAKQLGKFNAEVKRVIPLLKADLETELVKEFPDLQGYIGKQLALKQGEDAKIAQILEDQYLANGDTKTETGKILASILRADAICSFWSIGEKATGSKDPLGIRRDVLALLELLYNSEIDLEDLLLIVLKNLHENTIAKSAAMPKDLRDFIEDRIKYFLIDVLDYNLYLVNSFTDGFNAFRDIKYVGEKIQLPDVKDFLQQILRLENLISNSRDGAQQPQVSLLQQSEERELYSLYQKPISFNQIVADKEVTSHYSQVLKQYLDNIVVNHADEAIKNNRINLLRAIFNSMQFNFDVKQLLQSLK